MLFEDAYYNAAHSPELIQILLDNKVPYGKERKLIRKVNLPCFELIMKEERFRKLVDADYLEYRMYRTGSQRIPWVERLLVPEFLNNDQIAITAKVVKSAKYLGSRTNGGPSAMSRRIVYLVEKAFKDRNRRKADERKRGRAAAKVLFFFTGRLRPRH